MPCMEISTIRERPIQVKKFNCHVNYVHSASLFSHALCGPVSDRNVGMHARPRQATHRELLREFAREFH
jgi:hypothetical protein